MQEFLQYSPVQVIPGHGNAQKRRTMFICYLFKYCSLIIKNFTKYLKTHPSEQIHNQKNHLKSFSDVPESHKTSANLSDRAYFR